jgi:thioredoxin reductase
LKDSFKVTLLNGNIYHAKKLLISTGVTDEVPMLKGASEIYGKSMHHCPYCDGWEWRDKPIAVFGRGKSGFVLSQRLLQWSSDVVLITHGPSRLKAEQVEYLGTRGISVYTQPIERLEHKSGMLRQIVFRNGSSIERSAIFFTTGQHQRSKIGEQLGCNFSSKGTFLADNREESNVKGVFIAGDASRDMQFVIIAAAEGTRAAITIHETLLKEESEVKIKV